ncbi:MAG: polymerase ECF-type sigma factor [Alphaproteobacteria bacterium]|nr:polymerase ECF-type sigma factor [Alphaproteobacteria bacterium]
MDLASTFEQGLTEALPRLRRFAHSLSRNPADADDLAQQTVERALRSRSRWQEGSRLDAWLYRIMRNLWIDEARSRARKAKVERPPEDGEKIGFDPRGGQDAAIDLQRVMTALDRLPDEQRETVSLILIEGFGYREAAELLDLPIGTVSSRLVRGRTALLKMLGGEQNG